LKITKKEKKKLRTKYERSKGLEYVKGIKRYPDPSWFDWVGYMIK